jgi:hypothetical protein
MPLQYKTLIFLLCALLFLSGFSGCIFDNIFGTKFNLNFWSVANNEEFPTINLNFTASDKVILKMYDPSLNLIDSEFFYNDGETSLNIASYKETVKSGNYTLKVYNKDNREIYKKFFKLNGPAFNVISCEQQWWEKDKTFYLIGLKLSVLNNGDTPVYPCYLLTEFDNYSNNSLILPTVILPGENGIVESYVYYKGIPESNDFTITIKDSDLTILSQDTFSFDINSNINTRSYDKGLEKTLYVPYPISIYNYYHDLERLTDKGVEDYSVFVFDTYDDEYIDLFVDLIKKTIISKKKQFDLKTDVEKINYIVGFVQWLEYRKDSEDNESIEYAQYPIETMFTQGGGGDCEDKAILTSSLLNALGFEVALFRLPEHMAVGVRLNDTIPSYSYYTDDYYFLETTSKGIKCGYVPDEYKNSSELTVYPINHRPFLLHNWKDDVITIYSNTERGNFVKVIFYVQNLGNTKAEDIVVEGVFYTENGIELNSERTTIFSLLPGEKMKNQLSINIPEGYKTYFETRVYLNGEIVDTEKSKSSFP